MNVPNAAPNAQPHARVFAEDVLVADIRGDAGEQVVVAGLPPGPVSVRVSGHTPSIGAAVVLCSSMVSSSSSSVWVSTSLISTSPIGPLPA